MTDFFDKWYMSIQNKNNLLTKYRIYSLHRFIVRKLANFILPIYYRLTQNNSNYRLDATNEEGRERKIVSLTSFPARINRLWLVIETILRQTVKPDMVILWLSKEQFKKKEDLPKNLLKLQKRGLQIELRDSDLRSHKKYYYAFKEYPNDVIITVDDDVFYNSHIFETLLCNHSRNPMSVIANHTHFLEYDESGALKSYNLWSNHYDNDNDNNNNVQIGIGGVLYPSNCLYADVLKENLFMNLAKLADDLWLFSMARLNNIKVIKSEYNSSFLPIINKDNITLAQTNVGKSMNDKQIENIRTYYIKKMNIDPFK